MAWTRGCIGETAWISVLGLVGALFGSGCAGGDPFPQGNAEERVEEAQARQVDPYHEGIRQLILTFTDPARTEFGRIHIFSEAVGGYEPGIEYCFINQRSLGMLGRYGLTIAVVDDVSAVPPPDPGYASEQTFSLEQYPSGGWGSAWTRDPVSGGALYGGPGGVSLRLSQSTSTPSSLTRITWYQVLPQGTRPENITPSGTFSISGVRVIVPSGYVGHAISQRI